MTVEKIRGPVRPTDSTDELVPGPTNGRSGASWWHNVWLVPVAAAVLGFLIYTLPPYLTFDPSKQGAPLNKSVPSLDYALLVAHIWFGTIALVTVVLQVWPWLRRRVPVFHRWVGRTYVWLGALPCAILSLGVNYLHTGWHGDIGSYLQGSLLFITAWIGWRAARNRQWVKHRRWMLYTFGMATSIVWGLVAALTAQYIIPHADFTYVIEWSRWGGWLINLFLVKWYLDWTARKAAATGRELVVV